MSKVGVHWMFLHFIFFPLFLLLCWVEVHYGIYKSSYNITNISYFNSPPPPFSFICPCSHSWNSFNWSHFSIYINVYTVFAPYSPLHTLSPPFLPPTGANPQVGRYPSCSPILLKEKKCHFYLFKIAIPEVSVWLFQEYMHYNLNWFISSTFLLSTLVPVL
jgi:hypothetical protein